MFDFVYQIKTHTPIPQEFKAINGEQRWSDDVPDYLMKEYRPLSSRDME